MAFADWSGRLTAVGASANEVAAIGAAYYATSTVQAQALDTLISGISNAELLIMLNTWRSHPGPFQDGFPGGGLPFGTGVAVLTGNPADDVYGIAAGTGRRIPSGNVLVGSDGAVGGPGGTPLTAHVVTRRPVLQRLLGLLKSGDRDVSLANASDSTGIMPTATTAWFYLVGQQLASQFPAFAVLFHGWNTTTHAYDSPITVQAGTGTGNAGGPFTLHLYNGAIGGSVAEAHQAAYFSTMYASLPLDAIFVSLSENEGQTTTQSQSRQSMLNLVERIARAIPGVEVCLLTQAPRFDAPGPTQALRRDTTKMIASIRGYDIVDTFQAFYDYYPNGSVPIAPASGALIQSDDVHPTALGAQVWAAAITDGLVFDVRFPPRSQQHSSLFPGSTNLVLNGDFAACPAAGPLGWTNDGCTITQDATNFQGLNGYSVRLQSAGAARARIFQTLPTNVLKRLAGRYVTFTASIYRASGALLPEGVVGVFASAGSGAVFETTNQYGDGIGGAFVLVSASIRVPDDVSAMAVSIYADTQSTGTADISVDRCFLAEGILPRDSLLAGGQPTAIWTAANAFQTADMLDRQGPATSSIVRESRLFGDAQPRWVEQANGNMQWGPGNAALDASLTYVSPTILKFMKILQAGDGTSGTGLRIGSTATIKNHFTATAAWTPGAIANGASAETAVTVTGAALGDLAIASYSLALAAGLEISAKVTAANTVTVAITNTSGGSLTPSAGTVRASVLQY